jgi:Tol biopolymer transport system component
MSSQRKATVLALLLGMTVACGGDDSADTDGAGGTGMIVDSCTGGRELLPIPEVADLVFAAGIYAGDLRAPTEVYALDIDTDNAYRITCTNWSAPTCHYDGPHPSPDNQKLVVMRGCSDTNGDGQINFEDDESISVLDLAGDNAFELTGYRAVNSPDWSVNDEIVFAASPPAGFDTDIYRMDSNGQHVVNLTDTGETFENDCAWSPDGDSIVFARGQFVDVDPPNGVAQWVAAWDDLFVMDRTGGSIHKVVSFGGDAPCGYGSEYAGHFCKGLLADPAFFPTGESIVYAQLLSVGENGGRGRWNIFSASATALDQGITNLTNHPTAFQDVAHVAEAGIVFHEVDVEAPFYGLVLIGLEGQGRELLIDNSSWSYYLGAAAWLN